MLGLDAGRGRDLHCLGQGRAPANRRCASRRSSDRLPGARGRSAQAPLRALVFDAEVRPVHAVSYSATWSWSRTVRSKRRPDKLRFMHCGQGVRAHRSPRSVCISLQPKPSSRRSWAGMVGYVLAEHQDRPPTSNIGDTITEASVTRRPKPLPGYKEAKPVVFSSIYPMATEDYGELRRRRWTSWWLNDSVVDLREGPRPTALGYGFRCGFPRPAAP